MNYIFDCTSDLLKKWKIDKSDSREIIWNDLMETYSELEDLMNDYLTSKDILMKDPEHVHNMFNF